MPQSDPFSPPKQLTSTEIIEFVENGFLVLHGIFSKKLAAQIVPLVWNEMHEQPDDPATWNEPIRIVEKVLEDLPIHEIITERYRSSIDDLCGAGRWETNNGVGYWINLFPKSGTRPSMPRNSDWHLDIKTDPKNTHSLELGLVAMEFFTDIESGGGGTAIRVSSHRAVAQIAVESGHSLAGDALSLRAEVVTRHFPVIEITAQAGDILLMHPFTLHATSSNTSERVRIAANRPISLFGPTKFDRNDPSLYSTVEWAVVDGVSDRRPSK